MIDRSIVPPGNKPRVPTSQVIRPALLSLRIRVLRTQILAYMLDSLVRVSRRVNENHFVNIANTQLIRPNSVSLIANSQNFVFRADYKNRN